MFWFEFWLVLHIFAAIVAFGPTFVFPLIVKLAQEDPRNLPFASLLTVWISEKVTLPLGISMAVSGIGLIVTAEIDFFGTGWLIWSVVIYMLALLYSILVQRPAGARMLELMRSMPPGPPVEGGGPPPEIPALGKKLQMGGMLLGLATIVIIVLMIWQPGGSSLR